mgnify:CR=1 FL=1
MKVRVYHSPYGCDSGCCGHVVELENGKEQFEFDHPYREDPLTFAKRLVTEAFGAEHVKDLDWENCTIVDD